MKFENLNIIEPILRAITDEGYETPSPIQEKSIPPILEGRDLLGCAQTGTGKTAAFAIPILQLLSDIPVPTRRRISALVLTPTRERAIQIAESFGAYGRYTKLKCAVIFGGVSQEPQVKQLRHGVDILIATPGRLNDLINQKLVNLEEIKIFVLDEADRMLDMGFAADMKKISAKLPRRRQTLLFSATMPKEIENMANSMLYDPAKITVTPVASTVDSIEQSLYFVDRVNKKHLLASLLENNKITSVLVFTRTKHGADRVVKDLIKAKIKAEAIHGDKSQNARQRALSNFKNGQIRVLVATDIAARGIDIDELSHVVNYDLPETPETYVHRIGRTGRAGLGGTAISFCDFDEKSNLKDIENLIKKTIPKIEDHPYPMEVFEPKPKPVPFQRPKKPNQGSRSQHVRNARKK